MDSYAYTTDIVCANGWGYGSYAPPPGRATMASRQATKPTQEYLTGGHVYAKPTDPKLLPTTVDDAVRAMGPRLYEAMNTDPVVRSAKDVLRHGAMAGGMDLAPSVKPKAGAKKLTPEEQAAKDAVDACWRSVERIADWDDVALDLLEAIYLGVRLAEPTFELATTGKDAGKMVLATLRVKANDAWQFVVDDYLKVIGVQSRPLGDSEPVIYPAEKFIWLTNSPKAGDPRGTSDYRPAVEPWSNKVRFWPELYKHLAQFGGSSLIGKLSLNHTPAPALDAYGNPVVGGANVDPEVRMGQSLQQFRNGCYMVISAEDDVIAIPPQGNGEAFHNAFALANREIMQAIHGTPSATLEAEHDSRAKGETGRDIVDLKIEAKRKALSAVYRRLFRMLLTLNLGPEQADLLTPMVTFGQTEIADRPAMWGAAGGLKSSGYLGESQIAELDQMIGLPIRDAEADEAKAKAKAEEAMKAQQTMGPKAPDVDGNGKPVDGAPVPPKPKPKPAEFALDVPLVGPWHDSDMTEGRAILNRLFPSAAAMRRWERDEETDENRRVLLGYLVDDAKALLRARGEQLLRDLPMATATAMEPAEFASPWEVVARWREDVARTLRRYYVAGALALIGPREFSAPEWETLRREDEVQLGYLDGFAGAVMDGSQTRDGTIVSRSGMYGDSAWVVAMAVQRTRMIGMGMTREHSWLGNSKDSCGGKDAAPAGVPSCRQEQAKGWQPIGTLTLPGRRKCKGACKCHMEYRL